MEPRALDAEAWGQISRALIYLFLFTGLGLTGAISFLFGGAMLPSLIDSRDVPAAFSALRWLTYPVCAVALGLAVYALLRGVLIAVAVAQQIYPRAWM
jgi:ABC-type bacteriocin/lantibiotic exporter with double-glycine peptidase domain